MSAVSTRERKQHELSRPLQSKLRRALSRLDECRERLAHLEAREKTLADEAVSLMESEHVSRFEWEDRAAAYVTPINRSIDADAFRRACEQAEVNPAEAIRETVQVPKAAKLLPADLFDRIVRKTPGGPKITISGAGARARAEEGAG